MAPAPCAADFSYDSRMERGFTWIEMLLVLAVLGALALVAIPAMQDGCSSAR